MLGSPEVSTRSTSTLRRLVANPGFVVPVVLVVAFAALGRSTAALVVLALLIATTIARLATGFRFDRVVERGAHRVGDLLADVIGGAAFVLVVLPIHLVRRVLRRSWGTRGTWVERTGRPDQPRRLGASSSPAGAHRSVLLRSVGVVAAVLVLNYLVGLAWNTVAPPPEPEAAPAPTSIINVTGGPPPDDVRVDDPAMGGVPWAEEYFDELNSLPVTYWPFVLFTHDRYEGRYVNGEGWTRESYVADHPGTDEVPLISFYGGSTMFGIGQRDDHTIPSEIARIAEAEGYPVRVANHGFPGFVSWQEMFLFEHFTAAGERPVRAVFYDGLNEVYAQRQPAVIGNPTDTEVEQMGDRIATAPTAGQRSLAPGEAVDTADVWAWYRRNSAANRAWDELGALWNEPAGAQAEDDPPDPTDAEDVGAAAVAVYERSRTLIEDIAEREDIEPTFFWQPVPLWDNPEYSYSYAVDRLTEPTISIADCLDGNEQVYLSDEHTNEEGARLVAECMWPTLEPAVRAWYRSNGVPRQEPTDPEDGSDIATGSEVADVGLEAGDLGPTWKTGPPVPNLLQVCLAELHPDLPSSTGGPSLADSSGSGTGRVSTVRIDLASEAEAASWLDRARAGTAVQDCMTRQSEVNMGITGGLAWDAPEGAAAPGTAAWRGSGFVRYFGSDTRFSFTLTQRGRSLVAAVAIGTDPPAVDATSGRVTAAIQEP